MTGGKQSLQQNQIFCMLFFVQSFLIKYIPLLGGLDRIVQMAI